MTAQVKLRLRPVLALLSCLVVLTGTTFGTGCRDRAVGIPSTDDDDIGVISFPQSTSHSVDLLFVIDNSGSMEGEQTNLRNNFPALMSELRNMPGGLPDLHIGVTSTDLGVGTFQITDCEDIGGDAGQLLTGECPYPEGARYIVDVEADGCEIIRDPGTRHCTTHDCGPEHCAHEPSTSFFIDDQTGCPRCRNYMIETLEDVFGCIANLGTTGCGFEQPLEAMYRAIDPSNTENAGFIREDALLGVVLLTDEDDCSASNPQLYDNTQFHIDSTLGPYTGYRCFEFGTSCDINSRTHQGTRHNCVVREDAAALLHHTSRYVQQLESQKDPQLLVVAAIAGPVTLSADGIGHDVIVGLDDLSQPEVQPTCTNSIDDAKPALRVYDLIAAFNAEDDITAWAYNSVCSSDYTPALQGIGNKILDVLRWQCLPRPARGCADPGIEFGSPQAQITCEVNSRCLADCTVVDVFQRGTSFEQRHDVPPCLEILPDGTRMQGNTDRTLAYANGHPNERDTQLPVSACWHINFELSCPESNFAELRVARRADPPSRSFAEVNCDYILEPEQQPHCGDGVDNDENCRVDMDDPCCTLPSMDFECSDQ